MIGDRVILRLDGQHSSFLGYLQASQTWSQKYKVVRAWRTQVVLWPAKYEFTSINPTYTDMNKHIHTHVPKIDFHLINMKYIFEHVLSV